MRAVLVTGASGFLGRYLVRELLKRGLTVYALSHARETPPGTLPVTGDIRSPALGIDVFPAVEAIWHLAAVIDLSESHSDEVIAVNITGTRHAVELCARRELPLYACSTAFAYGRNSYEKSKAECERLVRESGVPFVIYKPSILVADSRDGDPGSTRGFYQFVGAMARVHRRAELIRRKIEGTLRLPVIEPILRIKGNPEATLNLLPVDVAAEFMASHTELGRTYQVTNPQPPTLAQLAEWVGEALLLRIRFLREFKATPIEAVLGRLTRSFNPYLWGDVLPSDLPQGEPLVSKELVQYSAARAILHI